MYVACSCLACDKSRFPTVESAVAKIRELGFNVFDLDVLEGWQHVNASDLTEHRDELIDRFAPLTADETLIVSSLNCSPGPSLTDPDRENFQVYKRRFDAILDLAECLLSLNVTLQPGSPTEHQDQRQAMRALVRHLSELSEMALHEHLDLSVEPHAGSVIEDPEDALAIVEELYPGVGITYDPSHFVMRGIPLEQTRPLLDYVRHVHVRNASRGKMQDSMDSGTVDFEWLIKELAAVGYDDAVTIEYFGDYDPDFRNVCRLRDRLIELGVGEGAEWPEIEYFGDW
jgi:sugar phosphate isomerase/epimerase